MTTVDEYVRLAEAAEKEGAHVAVLMYCRSAIEEVGYNQNVAPFLLKAVQYSQRLKKAPDREAVALWGIEVLERMNTPLAEIINREIAKLKAGGNRNATA